MEPTTPGATATADAATFKRMSLDELVDVRENDLQVWIGGLPTSLQERVTGYVDAVIAHAHSETDTT